MLRSSSNRACASALASSVLPTPVGPRNRKLPMGRLGLAMPARLRRMASLTLVTASSCPMTRWCSTSSRCSSFSRSPSTSFSTGMPVQRATMRAISSSVTRSRSRLSSFLAAAIFSSSSSCFLQLGQLAVFQLGGLVQVVLALSLLDGGIGLLDLLTQGSAPCRWHSSRSPTLPSCCGTYPAARPAPFPDPSGGSGSGHRSPFSGSPARSAAG